MHTRHLNWHAALQSIACGDFPDARRRADTALAHEDVGMRAATNWRLLLVGQAPAGRSDLEHVRELLTAPVGMAEIFHTFNLALALAVEAATDDLLTLAKRAGDDERPTTETSWHPWPEPWPTSPRTPRAAADLLSSLGEKVDRIGGVRVEREIIQDARARAAALLHHHPPPPHLRNPPPHPPGRGPPGQADAYRRGGGGRAPGTPPRAPPPPPPREGGVPAGEAPKNKQKNTRS
ncbi:hypothetical protein ACIBAJ_39505, partial [Streptomyces sp. NPDC051640]